MSAHCCAAMLPLLFMGERKAKQYRVCLLNCSVRDGEALAQFAQRCGGSLGHPGSDCMGF